MREQPKKNAILRFPNHPNAYMMGQIYLHIALLGFLLQLTPKSSQIKKDNLSVSQQSSKKLLKKWIKKEIIDIHTHT